MPHGFTARLTVTWVVLTAVVAAQASREPIPAGNASIAGRVTDAQTRQPLSNVTVTLLDVDTRAFRVVTTDADGRYRFAVPAGAYRVHTRLEGYADQWIGVVGLDMRDNAVRVAGRDAVEGLDFVLTRGAVVGGRITDQDGTPVRGAGVTARWPRDEARTLALPPLPVFTDADGRYTIRGVAPGRYVIRASPFVARRSDDPPSHEESFFPGVPEPNGQVIEVLSGDPIEHLDFVMPRIQYFDVNGVVTAPNGSVPDDLELVLTALPAGTASRKKHGDVSADGSFSFERLRGGRYLLWARSRGAEGTIVASRPIEIEASLSDVRLDLVAGGRVAGRIITESGEPLPAAPLRVAVGLLDGEIDIDPQMLDQVAARSDGRFEVDGLFGDRWFRILGLPDGWELARVEVGRTAIERVTMTIGVDVDNVTIVIARR